MSTTTTVLQPLFSIHYKILLDDINNYQTLLVTNPMYFINGDKVLNAKTIH